MTYKAPQKHFKYYKVPINKSIENYHALELQHLPSFVPTCIKTLKNLFCVSLMCKILESFNKHIVIAKRVFTPHEYSTNEVIKHLLCINSCISSALVRLNIH